MNVVKAAPSARSWRIRTFRRWHRWIGFTAAVFLVFAGITGTIVAFTEFFGPEEHLREANRKLISPFTVRSSESDLVVPLERALATVAAQAPGAPVDKITIEFKGEHPRVQVFTGKPGGGEDRQFVIESRTGQLRSVSGYADKPFLYRLHSGEAFGDGGLVIAMFWGLALVLMTASGFYIYLTMRRQAQQGLRRIYW